MIYTAVLINISNIWKQSHCHIHKPSDRLTVRISFSNNNWVENEPGLPVLNMRTGICRTADRTLDCSCPRTLSSDWSLFLSFRLNPTMALFSVHILTLFSSQSASQTNPTRLAIWCQHGCAHNSPCVSRVCMVSWPTRESKVMFALKPFHHLRSNTE